MATINNPSPGNRPVNDGDLTVDFTRPNRQMNDAYLKEVEARQTQEAQEHARKANAAATTRPDRIEVSSAARLLLAQSQEKTEESDAAERKQRVAELREEYLDGTLATKARAEKAADSLLGA